MWKKEWQMKNSQFDEVNSQTPLNWVSENFIHRNKKVTDDSKMEEDKQKGSESNTDDIIQDLVNTTSVYDNFTTSNQTISNLGRDEDLAKFEIAVSAVIFALAILGNGLVLIILLTSRSVTFSYLKSSVC